MQTTDILLYKNLHKNIDKLDQIKDHNRVMTAVAQGKLIFIEEESLVGQLRAMHPYACDIALGKEKFYSQNIAFPIRKSFPQSLRRLFNAK